MEPMRGIEGRMRAILVVALVLEMIYHLEGKLVMGLMVL